MIPLEPDAWSLPVVRLAHRTAIDSSTARKPHQLCGHQFVYVLHGSGEVVIDDRAFEAAADRLYLLLPGAWYTFRAAGDQAYEFLSIHFAWRPSPALADLPMFRLAGQPALALPRGERLPSWPVETQPYLDLRGRLKVRRLLEEIVLTFREWDPLSQREAAGLLLAASMQIVRDARDIEALARYEGVGADAIRRVEQARRMLECAQEHPVSVDEAARNVGWTSDYLRRMFRRILATSPQKLQRSARVGQAREMLRDDAMSVNEIAAACGFDDQAYFGRVFKAETGLTPTAYRQRLRP